jgi:hypothetical protein
MRDHKDTPPEGEIASPRTHAHTHAHTPRHAAAARTRCGRTGTHALL